MLATARPDMQQERREARRTLPDELRSTEVWPLLVEALSTSLRPLPFMAFAPPLRRPPRALEPCRFWSLSLSDSWASSVLWVRFGGIAAVQWAVSERCRQADAWERRIRCRRGVAMSGRALSKYEQTARGEQNDGEGSKRK